MVPDSATPKQHTQRLGLAFRCVRRRPSPYIAHERTRQFWYAGDAPIGGEKPQIDGRI
jgi:hypothetical protein